MFGERVEKSRVGSNKKKKKGRDFPITTKTLLTGENGG
jgi:hypothetical protein